MAHQEASRSKYIIAFIVANFASSIAAKLGDLIFSASDYFNSAIRTGEVEQALYESSAISGLLAAATWIVVFLMFKNIYFQRMLWYVIAGYVIGGLMGFSALSQMQDLLGLTDIFLDQSVLLSFAIAMTVPLFFYVLRQDRYYPPRASTEPVINSAQASITTAPRQNETDARTTREEPTTVTKLPSTYQTLETKVNSGEGLLDQFAKAKTIIEYSPVAGAAWRRASGLSPDLQEVFLRCLEDNPKGDITLLVSDLEDRHEASLSPYDDIEANKALAVAREVSPDAVAEFQKVYAVLEGIETVESIINQITIKYTGMTVEEGKLKQDAQSKVRLVNLLRTARNIGDIDGMQRLLLRLGYKLKADPDAVFSGVLINKHGRPSKNHYYNKEDFKKLVDAELTKLA